MPSCSRSASSTVVRVSMVSRWSVPSTRSVMSTPMDHPLGPPFSFVRQRVVVAEPWLRRYGVGVRPSGGSDGLVGPETVARELTEDKPRPDELPNPHGRPRERLCAPKGNSRSAARDQARGLAVPWGARSDGKYAVA